LRLSANGRAATINIVFYKMLKGNKIILRAATEKDLKVLSPMRNDIDLQLQLMALPRPNTALRVKQWLKRRADDDQGIFFVIAERSSNRACGYIQLVNMDAYHKNCYLGIWLSDSVHGKGHAAEAMSLAFDYAADIFGMHKILLHVLAANERAISFYIKNDFKKAGVLKEHFFQKQKYHDVIVMEKILSRH